MVLFTRFFIKKFDLSQNHETIIYSMYSLSGNFLTGDCLIDVYQRSAIL